jgi:imidazolonepropionase-like amidohydrolase
MPGLIDAHFHAYGLQLNPALIDAVPPQLRGLHAKRVLEATLQRGFTTVRDAAGGDFGTDLLGPLMDRQMSEFHLRREVCTPLEILRSVTSVNAELLQMTGELGTIAPNALADILVTEGNPLEDINVLERQEAIRVIVRGGRIVRNALT